MLLVIEFMFANEYEDWKWLYDYYDFFLFEKNFVQQHELRKKEIG